VIKDFEKKFPVFFELKTSTLNQTYGTLYVDIKDAVISFSSNYPISYLFKLRSEIKNIKNEHKYLSLFSDMNSNLEFHSKTGGLYLDENNLEEIVKVLNDIIDDNARIHSEK